MKDINEILKISLDNIIEGCQIISPDFRYLYVNKSGARHGKSSVESLVGKRMVDVYPGIENTELFVQMKHSMDEKTPYRMENLFKFPDGSDGWFELRLDPVPEGLMILSVDITEEKGARNKLEELNKKLE
ncbi:MAG TPA: PAS domain-containing protein, partial [Candidatus Paceibacterota bacterium]